jgi:hypothetical protein
MSDKAPAFKFTTNVPVQSHIRFIDVRAGKLWDDPKTGQTKKLPAQVSIKGTFGGQDTICFLPGPAWKNIKALADGGVIDAEGMEVGLTAANDEALATNVSIPVKDGKVTALLAKPAGERYENMTFSLLDAPAAPVSKRIPPPPRKPLPFDEESFPPESAVYAVAPQEHLPVRQGNMPDLSAPAPSDADAPEWVAPAKPSGVAPKAEAKAAYCNAYFDLLGYVRAHSGLKDEVAIQAATATLHIGLKQEGLR